MKKIIKSTIFIFLVILLLDSLFIKEIMNSNNIYLILLSQVVIALMIQLIIDTISKQTR